VLPELRVVRNHIILPLVDPEAFRKVFPTIKTAKVNGSYVAALPHDVATMRLLRNRGYNVPSLLTSYNWPGRLSPYKHQRTMTDFLITNPRAYNLSGMGCISGDALISTNRRGCTRKITLRDLYARWTNVTKRPWSMGNSEWKCRSLKGDRFGLHQIEDVVFRGNQQTLRITTENGKVLVCTSDHRLAQPEGQWIEAGGLRVGGVLLTNGRPAVSVKCWKCGEERLVGYASQWSSAKKQCRKCYAKVLSAKPGDENPAWKGGAPYVDNDGYVRIYAPNHPRAQKTTGRVYEHILVAEAHFGISIARGVVVHHRNGIKTDNRPENLELTTAGVHAKGHTDYSRLDGGRTINGGIVVVVPKISKVVSIEDGGVTDVYDICMAAPYNNFVANGVVVHNSGKTASALWATDYLMRQGEVKKTLIVAPLSTLDRVWAQELFHVLPHRRFHILHGSRAKRIELLSDLKCEFYIINHDGVEIIADALAKRPDINHVIYDELAAARNARTHRARTMFAILNRQNIPRSAWGLTGTPTPTAPTDCFGQIRLLTPERYTKGFRTIQNELMIQVSQFKWVPKHGSAERVYELMQPSIRFALEDCIDLPPTIYQERECELTPQQQKHYKEMERQCFTEIQGTSISAVNAGVLLGKLCQASLGIMYDGAGGVVDMDFSPRLKVLKAVIEECDEKVIVFVPYTGALLRFYDELKNHWSVEIVDGSVLAGKRNRIFKDFQETAQPRVILAHPGTMAHGLTLTAATTIVWAAPVTSTETFLQANARISRPGQVKTAHIVMLWGSKVESRLYQTLKDRRKLQDLVLELAKEGRR